MHTLMTELHQDHVNLARLLELLNQQVELLASDDEPDYLLMIDIADYIRRYSDHVHHPREDEIYKVLLTLTDEAKSAVDDLLEEHQRLPAVTTEFYNMLDGILNDGAIISRQELQDKISHFIQVEREHINTEEGTVFPLINNTLQSADWAIVEADMQQYQDPLFGGQVLERYATIYSRLTAN